MCSREIMQCRFCTASAAGHPVGYTDDGVPREGASTKRRDYLYGTCRPPSRQRLCTPRPFRPGLRSSSRSVVASLDAMGRRAGGLEATVASSNALPVVPRFSTPSSCSRPVSNETTRLISRSFGALFPYVCGWAGGWDSVPGRGRRRVWNPVSRRELENPKAEPEAPHMQPSRAHTTPPSRRPLSSSACTERDSSTRPRKFLPHYSLLWHTTTSP